MSTIPSLLLVNIGLDTKYQLYHKRDPPFLYQSYKNFTLALLLGRTES